MSDEKPTGGAPFQREADAASVRAIDAHLARVRVLIAAAPEMEALMRELFPYFDPLPDDIDPGLGLLLTKMLMLVKRIDAAKAGE